MITVKNRFDNITFKDLQINTTNKDLIEYLQDYKNNIDDKINNCENFVITGSVGIGKTYIIKAFLNELKTLLVEKENVEGEIKKSKLKVEFIQMYDLIADLRKIYEQKEPNFIYKNCDILVIDECGIQFSTDAERNILYDLFNFRYEYYKPTILISNIPVENEDKTKSLKNILGLRIMDRVLSVTSKQFLLNGKSMRV